MLDGVLRSAARSVDVAMYELDDTGAEAILVAARHRGVEVRVLLDRAGPGTAVNALALDELSAGGVAVRWARGDELLHEKAVTVDGSVAVVMTGNLVERGAGETRDFDVLTDNPPAVSAVESTFEEDWEGAPVRSGVGSPGLVWSPGAAPSLSGLIARGAALRRPRSRGDAVTADDRRPRTRGAARRPGRGRHVR